MAGESPTYLAAEEMLHLMLAHATNGEAPTTDYKRCRSVLLDDPGHVPSVGVGAGRTERS
jgi:hypothetical protein